MNRADLLIINARELITVDHGGPVCGAAMGDLKIIEDGAVAIVDEKIAAVGTTSDILSQFESARVLNASDQVVSPGLVDSHTHAVFVGTREDEFAERLAGTSYMEIAKAGGGIARTTRQVRQASRDDLFRESLPRVQTMLEHGTTTAEVKSGYGLSTHDEIRLLEVAGLLNEAQPVDLVRTFLGAHAVPDEFGERREEYVALVCDEMIPLVAERSLAEFCDVFCEKGVFSVAESRAIFEAARKAGMKLKIHADEFVRTGGAALAASLEAVSADHLIFLSDDDMLAMQRAGTIAVLLPGTSYSLRAETMPPARNLIAAGVPVAIATDLNPGSCMTESLQMAISLACVKYRMSPAEAFTAATINAAHAISRGNAVGSLREGMLADLVVWNMPSYRYMPYHFGVNHAALVVKRGRVVWRKTHVTNH